MQNHSYTGWLLSLYADKDEGIVLWVVGEDGTRKRLTQSLETTFYIRGKQEELEAISSYLEQDPYRVRTGFNERKDLYGGPQKVLAVQTANPVFQQQLARKVRQSFRNFRLTFYDTSIPPTVRYAVTYGVFPTARCYIVHDENNRVLQVCTDDSPWEINYTLPGLRTMTVEPDADPNYSRPRHILISYGEEKRNLQLDHPAQVVQEFSSIFNKYDPDIILAQWGDSWLFPTLLGWAKEYHIPCNPSRDSRHPYQLKDPITFETYGVVHHRAQQTFLYGREHLDPGNITVGGFSLDSIFELTRVTALPVQIAGRNSPGAGFTAMQMAEALRRDLLVPEHKLQTEDPKSAEELYEADNGGLNYRPIVGLHNHVAALDFFSMYASVMVTWNISGETVGVWGKKNLFIPETNIPIIQDFPGLVPSILKPLLEKRLAAKRLMTKLWEDDPEYARLQAITDALKWLGYVSFGYQGFKHNLFGNIKAHEAITACGREMLVRAIEAAQELGYSVLAANTDSLFVSKPGYTTQAHFQQLIHEINNRTGLTIMPEAMFDWLAFLPSKGNPRIGAVNRYFGRMSNGKPKVRGLAQRRRDTPAWVAQTEKNVIEILLKQPDGKKLHAKLPEAVSLMQKCTGDLYQGRISPSHLIITRRLSREIDQFRGQSEVAAAVRQMMSGLRSVQVGEMVEYIYIRNGKPGVQAVDYQTWPDDSMIDKQRYCKLLERSIFQLLSPLGVRESDMPSLANQGIRQLDLFGGSRVWKIYPHI